MGIVEDLARAEAAKSGRLGFPAALWWCYVGCAIGAIAAVLPLARAMMGIARGYLMVGFPVVLAFIGAWAMHATRRVRWLGLAPFLSGGAMIAILTLAVRHWTAGPFKFRPMSGLYLSLLSGGILLFAGWTLLRDRDRRW